MRRAGLVELCSLVGQIDRDKSSSARPNRLLSRLGFLASHIDSPADEIRSMVSGRIIVKRLFEQIPATGLSHNNQHLLAVLSGSRN